MLIYRYEHWQKQDCCYLQLDRQQVCRTRVVQFLRQAIDSQRVLRRVFRRRGWFYRCFHWQCSSAISQPLIRSCYVNALVRSHSASIVREKNGERKKEKVQSFNHHSGHHRRNCQCDYFKQPVIINHYRRSMIGSFKMFLILD